MKKVKSKLRMLMASVLKLLSAPARIRRNLKLKSLKKRNRKKLTVFDSCDNLPAWRFFKILKTGELRYLLDCKKLPEYFTPLLEPVWDQILQEYDKLTGDMVFESAFVNAREMIEEQNNYHILIAIHRQMLCNDKRSLGHLEDIFGIILPDISVKTITKVEKLIKQRKTKLEIQAARNGGEEHRDDFIRSIVQISNILKRNIDKDSVTIAEYVYLNNDCKEIIKAHKKHGSNS